MVQIRPPLPVKKNGLGIILNRFFINLQHQFKKSSVVIVNAEKLTDNIQYGTCPIEKHNIVGVKMKAFGENIDFPQSPSFFFDTRLFSHNCLKEYT